MATRPSALTIVFRGLRKRCPACGEGRLFDGFFDARDRCDRCGLDFRDPQGDTWAILYLSTGAITGLFIVGLLLFRPHDLQTGRLILIPIVIIAFGATVPNRRGFAMAVHHVIRRALGEV